MHKILAKMKFKKVIPGFFIALSLIMIFSPGHIKASESILSIYDQETIYIHYSFMGNGFVKNGKLMNLGTFGSNLAREMAGSRYAIEEMEKARKYKISGSIANFVATAFGLTGIAMILLDKDDSRAFDITSIIIGGVCNVVAEAFNRSSMAAMNRAIWIYNRDVMSGWIKRE